MFLALGLLSRSLSQVDFFEGITLPYAFSDRQSIQLPAAVVKTEPLPPATPVIKFPPGVAVPADPREGKSAKGAVALNPPSHGAPLIRVVFWFGYRPNHGRQPELLKGSRQCVEGFEARPDREASQAVAHSPR